MRIISSSPLRPSLRERKKAATREAILSNARRLFEERGYDHVTVAEIADAADVSVKTLFVYFRSKEDLVFADTTLIDSLVSAIERRPENTSPAQAVGQVFAAVIAAHDGADLGVEGFHRGIGQSGELRSPLLRMWADYEDRIAAALADHAQAEPNPRTRLAAIQLVGILRSFTSPEIRRALADLEAGDQREFLDAWLDHAVAQIDEGLERVERSTRPTWRDLRQIRIDPGDT